MSNIYGTKDTASHRIDLHVPDDKTLFPALCSACRKLLPQGYTLRYIFADLYKKEEIRLYPIEVGTVFSLRCYQITIERNVETCSNRVIIQGILHE